MDREQMVITLALAGWRPGRNDPTGRYCVTRGRDQFYVWNRAVFPAVTYRETAAEKDWFAYNHTEIAALYRALIGDPYEP
jgi:hypothetical protein